MRFSDPVSHFARETAFFSESGKIARSTEVEMADAWAEAEALSKKALEGNGIFLRLVNDGDKTVVVFRGDPCARQVHWTGEGYADCAGQGCEHCATGNRSTLRVGFNVYAVSDRTMKIMEGGAKWFTDVVKVRNKYGLDKYAFEIERHGAAGSPKTTYSILPDVPIDDCLRARMDALTPHDLGSQAVRATVAAEVAASAPSAATSTSPAFEPPIDIGPAREIHQQLSRLAPDDVDAFKAAFGISKVTGLKARDEDKARQFIQERTLPF